MNFSYCNVKYLRLPRPAPEPATEPLTPDVEEASPHPAKAATPAEEPAPVVDDVPPVEAPATEESANSHTEPPAS
jgi:hypothetical protein